MKLSCFRIVSTPHRHNFLPPVLQPHTLPADRQPPRAAVSHAVVIWFATKNVKKKPERAPPAHSGTHHWSTPAATTHRNVIVDRRHASLLGQSLFMFIYTLYIHIPYTYLYIYIYIYIHRVYMYLYIYIYIARETEIDMQVCITISYYIYVHVFYLSIFIVIFIVVSYW